MRRFLPLLDLLVLKDLVPFFVTGIALFSGLWFAADPLLAAGNYLSHGAPFSLVVRVVVAYLPFILGLTLPMAMLLSALQGFGRLSGDSEAVALFAGGIPLIRIVAPAAAMGLVVSLIGYAINDRVASAANNQKAHLEMQIRHYAPVASSELIHEPLYLENSSNGVLEYFIQIEGGIDTHTGMMYDVTIDLYNQGHLSMTLQAAKAHYLGATPDDLSQWELTDVTGAKIDPVHQIAIYFQNNSLTSFKDDPLMSQELSESLNASPQALALIARDPQTLDFAQTWRRIQTMIAAGRSHSEILGAETDYWSRVALPFSALVFTLVGAPLGMRSQRSAKMTGWFLAILIIFGYYVLTTAMSFAGRGGAVPPMLAAFLPQIIGVILGGALVWRASR